MSVLVTGGAGFVGSHLVDRLCRARKNVIVVDNLSTGRIGNLEWAISKGGATFVHGDVSAGRTELEEKLKRATREPIEQIYHLASPASPTAYGARPWETLMVNSLGTIALIDLALAHGALLVYTSTSEVYGDPLVNPQPESYFGNVNPVGPRACYDEGKRFAETALSIMTSTRGLRSRIVRLFNCYGPRMQVGDGRLIPALFDAALNGRPFPIHGTGAQTRSITYVDDIIEGILRVAQADLRQWGPVNLGNDEELSIREIASRVAELCGVPDLVEYHAARPEDPMQRRPDLARAAGLGWRPTTSVRDGLAKTLAWFVREQRSTAA